MKLFAKLNDVNMITDVVVLDDTYTEDYGISFLSELTNHLKWKLYFIEMINEPSINGFYDPVYNVFLSPKEYESWKLDLESFQWTAPIPYPNDEFVYEWDENVENWVQITQGN